MEDLFFNATSDLDKLLDEFEQREAPSKDVICFIFLIFEKVYKFV